MLLTMTLPCKICRSTFKFSISMCRPRAYSNAGKCGGNKGGGKSPDGKSGSSGDKGDKDKESAKTYPMCQCPSDFNPSIPSMYDCRKYGHALPCYDVMPCFEPLPNVPTGIFRCTTGEVLGNAAQKCSCYQNPEYYSYQHMSYYDLQLILRCCRLPSPKTGRKP